MFNSSIRNCLQQKAVSTAIYAGKSATADLCRKNIKIGNSPIAVVLEFIVTSHCYK